MKLARKNGSTSNILRVRLLDVTSTSGLGKTGLTFSSSGLIISTIADNEATATTYTSAGSTTETITTLGTFAAPTATKCRFKEVDATNHPGLYEIQIADARFAVASAKSLIVSIQVAGAAPEFLEIDQGVQVDTLTTYTGNTPQTGDSFAIVNGASGNAAIKTETAAIKTKTDNLPASPAAVGSAMTLTSGERDSIADAHLDRADAIETGLTVRQKDRIVVAFAGGLSSGMTPTGGSPVFKGAGVATTRISGTLDASGNRTAVVLTP